MGFSRQEYWSGLPLPSCKTPLVDRYSCTVAINETQIPELHVLPIIELFPQYCMHLSFKDNSDRENTFEIKEESIFNRGDGVVFEINLQKKKKESIDVP